MSPELGKYAAEVVLAYGASLVLLAAIVASTWLRARRVKRELDDAEGRVDD